MNQSPFPHKSIMIAFTIMQSVINVCSWSKSEQTLMGFSLFPFLFFFFLFYFQWPFPLTIKFLRFSRRLMATFDNSQANRTKNGCNLEDCCVNSLRSPPFAHEKQKGLSQKKDNSSLHSKASSLIT